MDDLDRKLMNLMWENPRMPLRDISRRLGISRQTVHRRLQTFARIGVFSNLKASLAGDYIDEFMVAIWGQSNSASIERCLDKLGDSRFTWRAEVLGGNRLFVMAGLIDTADLDKYVKFVKSAAEMPEPTIGILCYDDGINSYDVEKKEKYRELTPFDLKIIDALDGDARRPVSEIAEEMGVSAKTVRRHLDDMISDGSMIFNQPWDLTSGEDMMTMLQVNLRSGADKVGVAKRLLSIDPVHFNYIRSFSDIPGLLIGLVFSKNPHEIRMILRDISADEDVLAVTPNLIYEERMYWDQDPRAPEGRNHSSGKAGSRRTKRVRGSE